MELCDSLAPKLINDSRQRIPSALANAMFYNMSLLK